MPIELKFDAQYNTQEYPVRKNKEFNGFIRQGDLSFEHDLLGGAQQIDSALLRALFNAYISDAITRNTKEGKGYDGFGNTIIVGCGPAPTLHLHRGYTTEDAGRLYLRGATLPLEEHALGFEKRVQTLAETLADHTIQWTEYSDNGAVRREAMLPPDWLQQNGFRALPIGQARGTREVVATRSAFYGEVMRRLGKEKPIKRMTWIADKEALKVVQHLRG